MERLQKVIAQAGIASRRKAEELIQQGKVKVNGKVVTELGTKVSAQDKVEVNNIPLEKETPAYFLLYKPTGVISSVTDDKGRKVVTDFFAEIPQRLFPIGRLDYDTSGLILMTNDGEFANILMHPKYKVDKTYVAKVKGQLTGEKIRMLEKGVMLEEGKTAPARVKILSWDKRKEIAIVQLTIHEGRNRQVRRMFEAVGCKVMKLKRERYAFLELGNLRPGDARELSPHEVKQLRALASTKPR
ncbi:MULTISPECIES: 23S rRNA pseudouridine(2605) synthase RluB [unclassified Bacillus (in: firmicutes)]|uniref:23S rRNA pseudouridine(2605) synthase RluB n=1 Tax=unclassified Bacillus (in: firmicutes) TaxID=185979 RepID=UPI0008ECA984|nr:MULTISPECIES: pseudouridine synthase [unclassified Bacillus (in: firmicutes)]SFI98871.1 ribosomal large subunit pseudouridine synthase B [Bacillus sp. 71mf]SFS63152.1 ribosomal large subunit pseudouridine synthase B [Bacillus sp. 103mf]